MRPMTPGERPASSLQARCAWDGLLIVACASWDVMAAVQRHQATPEHLAARRRVNLVESNRMRRARIREEVRAVRMLREVQRDAA